MNDSNVLFTCFFSRTKRSIPRYLPFGVDFIEVILRRRQDPFVIGSPRNFASDGSGRIATGCLFIFFEQFEWYARANTRMSNSDAHFVGAAKFVFFQRYVLQSGAAYTQISQIFTLVKAGIAKHLT